MSRIIVVSCINFIGSLSGHMVTASDLLLLGLKFLKSKFCD